MDPEVALLDVGVGPDAGNQLVLRHQLAGPLDQHDQDIERAAAEPDRSVGFQQQLLGRKQTEKPERKRPLGRNDGLLRHFTSLNAD